MRELRIALSFDHELSLGGARSYQRNLFEPTEKLFELAGELNVPLTFFTDIWSAIRFRDWDRAGFFEPYAQQLARALELGHDVQLHIHPHWIDSEFRDGTFVPSDNYCLASLQGRSPPHDIAGAIRQAFEALMELCCPADPSYRCIAFRGGGYNLQPESRTILGCLYDLGIRIDSTIAKGMWFHSNVNSVDYRRMPKQANWYIAPDGRLDEPADGGIFEVPIASMPRRMLTNIPFLVKRVLNKRHIYQSTGWSLDGQTSSMMDRIGRLFPRSSWTVSFDGHARDAHDVFKTLKHHVQRHAGDEVVCAAACSHPKFMGPYQRVVMRRFVRLVREEFANSVEFVTYRQIYDRLGNHPLQGATGRCTK